MQLTITIVYTSISDTFSDDLFNFYQPETEIEISYTFSFYLFISHNKSDMNDFLQLLKQFNSYIRGYLFGCLL